MSTFSYKARDNAGALIAGEMEGKNALAVKRALSDQGLFPTKVESKAFSFALPKFFHQPYKAKMRDLTAMTRQFYALFKAGIPMDRILSTLTKQTSNKGLATAIESARRDVSGGASLSQAFAKHPEYFNELYINLLNVGEVGGVLERSLSKLCDILKKEHKLVASVKSATLYPKIVIVVFIAVVALMITFVIPRFADFYASYSAELPLPTRILIAMSDAAVKFWPVALTGIIASYIFINKFGRTAKGKVFFDGLKLHLPVFGKLNVLVINARFGHILSALYKSGLPLASSLDVVGKAIGNVQFQKEVEVLNDSVTKGFSFADSISERKYFSLLMKETASVGEQTGTIDEMIETTAQFYDEEVDLMLDQLTTLIEPLLLVGIFGLVALLALAIFLPWWNVTKLILQGGG